MKSDIFFFSFLFFVISVKGKRVVKKKKKRDLIIRMKRRIQALVLISIYFPSNDRDRGAIQQGSSREHLRQPRPVAVEVAVCYVARIFNEFSSALVALGPLTPFSSCEIARVRMLPPTPTD